VEIDVECFATPKQGAAPDEYEDASHPRAPERVRVGSYTCAVADGATESSFSRLWAQLLVEGYAASPSVPDFDRVVASARAEWNSQVGSRILPWYAQEKVTEGAFAALAGVHITDAMDGSGAASFTGDAIGDTCVFHIRGHSLLASNPMSQSVEFTSRPFLVSTGPDFGAGEALCTFQGTLHSEDLLLLATDAFSSWILEEVEKGECPFPLIRDLGEPGCVPFDQLVSDLRSSGRLKNDDVTLLRLTCF